MTLRIEDYALIGDCKTAALVGRDGSIDWLCWPRFDSAACFAALLGTAENGRWLIAPKHPVLGVSRRYRPGTLVLETEFQTENGSAINRRLHAAGRRHQSCADCRRSVGTGGVSYRLCGAFQLRGDFSDQAMTLAAIDRLVHHATILEMNVESYRRKAALKRKRGPGN
jgi:GH15 family glucan-1,4-alpha-glucosidase